MTVMFKRLHSIALAAIAGLVLTVTATANTSVGPDNIFLTVTDLSTGMSYFFDTGVLLQNFSQDDWLYYDLKTDPNYQAFAHQVHPGDVVQYEVAAATSATTLPTLLFTSNDILNPVGDVRLRQAAASLLSYLSYVNATPSPTTWSAFLPAIGWESSFESAIGAGSIAERPGLSLFFNREVARSPGLTPPAFLLEFAGGWNYTSNGVLMYWTPD